MTTDAGTPTPWPIEDVVARDLSGWARSLYNCTTGDNHLRTSEYYQLIRDLDAYEIVIAAAREQIATLTAAEAERDALRQAMGFAQGAIEDAIYTEDGLDGETGERVLHIMQEAVERGTFDQTQIGSLPRPMLETENDALRARVAELENSALELSVCLRNLVFMAETSGGTAGRDEALCTAIAQARALLAPSSSEVKP